MIIMKSRTSGTSASLVAAGALFLTLGPAAAQDEPAQDETPAAPAEAVITEQESEQKLSDDMIGLPVLAQSDGEEQDVGSVQALLFDDGDRIVGLVVEVGGFLGFGAKTVALSYSQVEFQELEGTPVAAVVQMSREQLEEAPNFMTQADLEAQRQQEQIEMEQQMEQPTQEPLAPEEPPSQ